MPNREAHGLVGAAAGGVAAAMECFAYRERNPAAQPRLGQDFLHVAGGAVGGLLGSRLPDIIDPPSHPQHRAAGHDVAAHAVSWWLTLPGVEEWVDVFRGFAEVALARRAAAELDLDRGGGLWNFLRALGWRALEALCAFLAGVPRGVLAGAASHVALDACSPAGVPVAGLKVKKRRTSRCVSRTSRKRSHGRGGRAGGRARAKSRSRAGRAVPAMA